jgi:DNA polymerase I-like protein with 3'-5' exonuclease and polymerase domains
MKMAIVNVHEELGIAPLLTVHDETDYNIWDPAHAHDIADIMEHAIEMTVPQVVEPELGTNWGDVA